MKKTEFVRMPVDRLIPYARNARTHNDRQIEKVAKSIKEFGFLNPVIISADGGIIAGHCRVMAAKRIGLEEVPCIKEDFLTEAQKRAYILADNKLALDAGWDEELLALELSELKDCGLDIELTGFDLAEVEELLREDESKDFDEGGASDSTDEQKTKDGDVWMLGRHQLMCGDSCDAKTVVMLINFWQSITGKEAVREDGVKFNDV